MVLATRRISAQQSLGLGDEAIPDSPSPSPAPPLCTEGSSGSCCRPDPCVAADLFYISSQKI